MKKLLFIVSAVAVLATGTVFGVKAYQNSQHPMTDLMRQNIEALSDGEYNVDGHTVICNGEVCFIFGYKNRTFAAGCKLNSDFTCTIQKTELPDINLGL